MNKDPFSTADKAIRSICQNFKLYRSNEYIATIKGFHCSGKYPNSIQTVDDTPLKLQDTLICEVTGEEYRIKGLKPLIDFHSVLRGYIVTYKNDEFSQNIYNIKEVSGNSAIGTNAAFNLINQTPNDLLQIIDEALPLSKEKTQFMQELIDLKETSKSIDKNTFSKFSDLIAKHENLLIPLGTFFAKVIFGVK